MSITAHDPSSYDDRDLVPVCRALISVSDKTGLLELGAALVAAGVELVSTGSTAATLRGAGHEVTDVSAVTGFPESLDGRVKTLHPAVHAGILADLRLASHREQLQQLDIAAFELVVVNLYPFRETVAGGADAATVVENIDIGGPALVRASAKNHANVAIVVNPADYSGIVAALAVGGTTLAARRTLATRAFAHTASYDSAVAAWFAGQEADEGVAGSVEIRATLQQVLRYGENSHQKAALYVSPDGTGIAQATQLHGKEMSYNNYVDADAAVRAAYDFVLPAVAIIKHANPCGIAIASGKAIDPIASAHRRAHECDPVSAFGGVIAANRPVTLAMAETVKEIFTEVLVAPGFEPEALEVLKTKKNLRLLQLPDFYAPVEREFKQISGGLLLQEPDRFVGGPGEVSSGWQLVAGEPADADTMLDLEFAWKGCRAVKSNAILLAKAGASVGVGMGQVNRVDSCHLAVTRAGERASGSVAASDAFFPFADGLDVLLAAGVKAVVQPGGSVRDAEVIDAATRAGITMYTTGERHFFH
ncbi:bifunctional phosphoribosylaminoimidazolecarboxamide formyltransferase/inosine monophosphate cyclohydrolase [Rathayibacter rathayi]|uniref:bifunctional phosphoribosylaminoimidazolecarboxamide formyltransferase/IMP cyclohydrolase n=1 Tax=Rathayibacter rathayi TaxID=33887 RepID=UPI000CE79092|nr:bifunctional phosphoribosylaminoimidazolecarboxamide formyltransferase/IMP cyclohydrolase [Rathayibacter rathayi]PPG69439.1 bifunctional phosphoribosylaminoimidazolecarboxamide formyltransferase/inosine monophosphate cyclohydrolase [Rathayibacter rathayi]PPG77200.1 bifunctional phosphoribosylaminoimidazolecarboxamide formyltransferase/inosine monophosphate cyclohydrolase [Rathayibacter rathayi]PPH24045.1 bifunctional phosphoribosylaminoimidazolecarboxamide formyltransferase/inosine monophosph